MTGIRNGKTALSQRYALYIICLISDIWIYTILYLDRFVACRTCAACKCTPIGQMDGTQSTHYSAIATCTPRICIWTGTISTWVTRARFDVTNAMATRRRFCAHNQNVCWAPETRRTWLVLGARPMWYLADATMETCSFARMATSARSARRQSCWAVRQLWRMILLAMYLWRLPKRSFACGIGTRSWGDRCWSRWPSLMNFINQCVCLRTDASWRAASTGIGIVVPCKWLI